MTTHIEGNVLVVPTTLAEMAGCVEPDDEQHFEAMLKMGQRRAADLERRILDVIRGNTNGE